MKLPIDYKSAHYTVRKKAREQYAKEQNGLCQYCKNPLSGYPPKKVLEKRLNMELLPDNFLMYPVHLHHDHKTGLTIGAVHCYCNGVSFQYDGV